MERVKNFVKKTFLYTIVFSLLVSTSVFAVTTTQEKEIRLRNAKNLIDDAANAQVIANAMKKCISSLPDLESVGSNRVQSKEKKMFSGRINDVDVSVGAWVEEQINGKVGDGEIHCKDNGNKILTLFSNVIDVSVSDLLCNAENQDYAGLIERVEMNDLSEYTAVNSGCSSSYTGKSYYSYNNNNGAGTNKIYGKDYSTGETYIKLLYEHWRENSENQYIVPWNNLGDFKNPSGYYALLDDYHANCGETVQPDGWNGDNKVIINEITDEGQEIKSTYQYSSNAPTTSSPTGVKRTCSEIASTINSYYNDYRDALYNAFKSECSSSVKDTWSFEFTVANGVLSDDSPVEISSGGETWSNYTRESDGTIVMKEFSDNDKEAAQQTIDDYNALKDNDFVTEDSGKWTCHAPLGYKVVMDAYVDPSTSIDDESGSVKKTCANSGGAESLGWIVCPVLNWLSNVSNDVYNDYVEPSLQVNPKLFGTDDSNNGAYQGWETFRNFANIAFIILLLIVIFSQLTGVGIDNYGIKKILPKLIVAAILINLSYVICMVLVDLSNIVGSGVRSMFDNLGQPINDLSFGISDGGAGGDQFTLKDTTTIISGVGILATIVIGAATIWANPAILLSLLVSALGIFVAIFFLFILLAAREAAIVVLVVLSPLAFVCYMLPNTKKLFDRWWKFFEGLLLVYPIIGLLVGGGNYVSRLLMTTGFADPEQGGSFITAFTAMIVGIIPIFFIPTVLKGSFAAMGKVGGMITGFGQKASLAAKKGVTTSGKAIGSTDTFRRVRNAVGMHSLSRRGRARAVQDQAALMKERATRSRLADRNSMRTRMQSIAASEEARAVDEATAQRLSLMQSSGKSGGLMVEERDANGNLTMVRKVFNANNAGERLKQLEEYSRNRELNDNEKLEVSALLRGLAGEKGGARQISEAIRNSGIRDESGNIVGANKNFMSVVGQTIARDSTVKSKMNEKDAGASTYAEEFMPGGDGVTKADYNQSFSSFKDTENYKNGVNNKIKSYEAGLNQSGAALDEYINGLTTDDCQRIMDDQNLLNSLDVNDRNKFLEHAKNKNVTGRSAREVVINNGQGSQFGGNFQDGSRNTGTNNNGQPNNSSPIAGSNNNRQQDNSSNGFDIPH